MRSFLLFSLSPLPRFFVLSFFPFFFRLLIKRSNKLAIVFSRFWRKTPHEFSIISLRSSRHSHGFSLITSHLRRWSDRVNFQRSLRVRSRFILRRVQNTGWIFNESLFNFAEILLRYLSFDNDLNNITMMTFNFHFGRAFVQKSCLYLNNLTLTLVFDGLISSRSTFNADLCSWNAPKNEVHFPGRNSV